MLAFLIPVITLSKGCYGGFWDQCVLGARKSVSCGLICILGGISEDARLPGQVTFARLPIKPQGE
jgi:hypothetical protein